MSANWTGKSWMQTHPSCIKFYPLKPRCEDIEIADIARHLSMQCRYAGGVSHFYSVAEHCVRVSREVERRSPPETRLMHAQWGLLHDASEAYLQDIINPIKQQAEFKGYRAAEKRLQDVICTWAGLPTEEPEIVKQVDHDILGTEARQLKAPVHSDWIFQFPNRELPAEWPGVILGWSPEKAEEIFLRRYWRLFNEKESM